MIALSVQFPEGVPHEVIAQTLAYIGGRIVDAAPVRTVAKSRKVSATKAADYQDLTVFNKETGEVKREIDGVTVAKLIAKMEGARKRAHSTVHRVFDDYAKLLPRCRDEQVRTAEYMTRFCSYSRHVKAEYTNGVTA